MLHRCAVFCCCVLQLAVNSAGLKCLVVLACSAERAACNAQLPLLCSTWRKAGHFFVRILQWFAAKIPARNGAWPVRKHSGACITTLQWFAAKIPARNGAWPVRKQCDACTSWLHRCLAETAECHRQCTWARPHLSRLRLILRTLPEQPVHEAAVVLLPNLAQKLAHGRPVCAAELDTLVAGADIVVVLLPLTPATRGIVDRKFLARMRRCALLVNAGRHASHLGVALICSLGP